MKEQEQDASGLLIQGAIADFITAEQLQPDRLANLSMPALQVLCSICNDHDISLSELRHSTHLLSEDELRTVSIALE